MKNLQEVIETIKEHYPYLKTNFGLKKIGVFGSVAQNTNNPKSDIDLVVEFEQPLGFRFVEFVQYMEKILQSKVDVLTVDGIKNIRVKRVASRIQKEIVYV